MKVKIKLLEEYMEQCLDFEVGQVTKAPSTMEKIYKLGFINTTY